MNLNNVTNNSVPILTASRLADPTNLSRPVSENESAKLLLYFAETVSQQYTETKKTNDPPINSHLITDMSYNLIDPISSIGDSSDTEDKDKAYPLIPRPETIGKKQAESDSEVSSKQPYICKICGQFFRSQSILTKHYRIHIEEKLFSCKICDQSFISQNGLTMHNRTHIEEKKSFPCQICDESFTQKSSLVRHQNVHTERKPFVCLICGMRLRHNSSLVRHQKVHDEKKPFACLICGIRFNQHPNLRRHQLIHTGEKPHKCEICGICFNQRSILVRHRRIHTREKPR